MVSHALKHLKSGSLSIRHMNKKPGKAVERKCTSRPECVHKRTKYGRSASEETIKHEQHGQQSLQQCLDSLLVGVTPATCRTNSSHCFGALPILRHRTVQCVVRCTRPLHTSLLRKTYCVLAECSLLDGSYDSGVLLGMCVSGDVKKLLRFL